MESNEIIREELFKVIQNQFKANDPPETKIAFDRLTEQGYTEFQAMQLIGQCLAIEVYGALKNKNPYNHDRYVKNLNNLPKEPVEK